MTFDRGSEIGGRRIVASVPPAPWPVPPEGLVYPEDVYGPPGTRWEFDYSDALARLSGFSDQSQPYVSWWQSRASNALNRYLAERDQGGVAFVEYFYWDTPAEGEKPIGAPMRWIHCTINARLGDNETLSHTLNFRTAPAADVDQDEADIQTFADQVRDAWKTMWITAPAGHTAPVALHSGELVYTDVTAAYLEQTAPATISTRTSRKTGHPVKVFTYPRPNYLVPTQFSLFNPVVSGGATDTPLPFEVAACLSLKTGLRGPRNRGRLYLGGLPVTQMGGDGNLQASYAQSMAAAFAGFVHAVNTGTGGRVHVVSRAYATSVGVNGITCGVVPDSQRRRRRSRDELYVTAVAT